MRLFYAIDLPAALAEPLAALQSAFEAAEGLRFTDPENAHVTMKFLGEVDADADGQLGATRLGDVKHAGAATIESAAVVPFEAEVGGLGVFPSLEYISVLWTGIREGAEPLMELQRELETQTTDLGFDSEDNAFTPHVTLARMDDARGKSLVQEIVRNQDPTVGRFEVSELRLKRSELTADGSVYHTVARFPL